MFSPLTGGGLIGRLFGTVLPPQNGRLYTHKYIWIGRVDCRVDVTEPGDYFRRGCDSKSRNSKSIETDNFSGGRGEGFIARWQECGYSSLARIEKFAGGILTKPETLAHVQDSQPVDCGCCGRDLL
jgi:hypothetical protein